MDWIVTDNLYQETWRRLLEFANIELTLDANEQHHGKPESKSEKENYQKQAKQVRVSILQAKEYFDAAIQSSLFTSPNHVYYGMVAITSMMMLILGDGSRALDYLRKDSKNSHHGLDFSTGCTATNAANGLSLIENSYAKINKYGHFANWYATLPQEVSVSAIMTREVEGGTITNLENVGGYKITPFTDLVETKKSILDRLKFFPDLHRELSRFGVHVTLSRITHQVLFKTNGMVIHTWFIHGAKTSEERNQLLENFKCPPRYVNCFSYNLDDNLTGGIVNFSYMKADNPQFSWPNWRETMNQDIISYAEDPGTIELADYYIVAYQLSMLSRYYPDLWIRCIESHCKAAKLIEQTVDVLIKKVPIMALSVLYGPGVTISTQREPWK